MSDLIRKSDVLELLYEIFNRYNITTDKITKLHCFGTDVFKEIRNMPTAYSVDKVVEELEKESYAIMLDGAVVASKEVVIDAKRATEIVKQGGVSNTADKREIARLCDYAIAENMILTGRP